MKKNLIAVSVFVFGLVVGATASASGVNAGGPSTSITPEMAQCVSDCQAAGGAYQTCWSCCVKNICPVELAK